MVDELRQRLVRYLDARQAAVLSAWVWGRPWALPVQYRRRGLEIECLLPRWAEIVSHLAKDPEAFLLVPDARRPTSRWLEYRGRAAIQDAPDWTGWGLSSEEQKRLPNRFAVLRITPQRIDLVDESRGWGHRETLDL